MPITYEQWVANQPQAKPERHVTPEGRADAQRAQSVIDHPGFNMFLAKLDEHRTRIETNLKSIQHRLCHGRGVAPVELHRLREDIAACDGWLNALDVARDLLPEIVKAGRETQSG